MMLNRRRKLRLIFIGGTLLTMFIFILVPIWVHIYEKYTTERNVADLTIDEIIQRCSITICTPCQYLNPEENRELLDNGSNNPLQFTQYHAFPPPKITKLEDFPMSGVDRVEKIIHQKWNTKNIPIQFRDPIKSFLDNHLSWKYMLWTDQSTRKFIKDHFRQFLSLYDSYVHPINRADSMRYMILFYYGGVYTDLDMQCLRPLDPMIKKYSCFLAQEPHVHSIVLANFYEQAANGFMACRKRHPFMKNVLENLNKFVYYANELDSTGPRFLTFSLRQYLENKAAMEITDDNFVYLAPPEYFLPTVDKGMNKLVAMQCRVVQCLSSLRKWQCEQWRKEGLRSEPYAFSFTNHFWAHITYQNIKAWTYFDIFEICPGASIYG